MKTPDSTNLPISELQQKYHFEEENQTKIKKTRKMGRGKVELKRIENKINRQVTFSKRRNGLLKKAQEISVLCDADVALIIFSPKGKLFEYSTDSCLERVLERYERCSYSERQVNPPEPTSFGSWALEKAKLNARLEVLQKNLKHYAGEDLGSLSLKELQSLEQRLESALKHIRSKKNQKMHESISALQKRTKSLQEQNSVLAKNVKQKKVAEEAQSEQRDCDLNIGHKIAGDEEESEVHDQIGPKMPSWMRPVVD